jgi:excisionase family DNA binding protein
MNSGEDNLWLVKVNPKLLELLDRFLQILEQSNVALQHHQRTYRDESEESGLLTVSEAAQRLRISGFTLLSWVSQRRIPYVKIGRRALFNPSDLDNFIKSCTIEPRRPKTRSRKRPPSEFIATVFSVKLQESAVGSSRYDF